MFVAVNIEVMMQAAVSRLNLAIASQKIANMIGSGVFLLPASLAPYGGLSLLGWGVSAAGSV